MPDKIILLYVGYDVALKLEKNESYYEKTILNLFHSLEK